MSRLKITFVLITALIIATACGGKPPTATPPPPVTEEPTAVLAPTEEPTAIPTEESTEAMEPTEEATEAPTEAIEEATEAPPEPTEEATAEAGGGVGPGGAPAGNEDTYVSDVLFYDPTTGTAEFYSTDGLGKIGLLNKYPNWSKGWNIIPGNFGGDAWTD
ncbi:MAG: hypothetical protein JXB30_09070, partial [Anaerolineae bacterium]|nr:hypothetical protein [Anaerolineae bacterium]